MGEVTEGDSLKSLLDSAAAIVIKQLEGQIAMLGEAYASTCQALMDAEQRIEELETQLGKEVTNEE